MRRVEWGRNLGPREGEELNEGHTQWCRHSGWGEKKLLVAFVKRAVTQVLISCGKTAESELALPTFLLPIPSVGQKNGLL